ncbi:hypothetical protein [Motilibacter deserti]|uniref:NADH-quinone oxidoreductase subunit J n=1 Tax=Motilibacter deserti TaxID=2714956 RepID=A0ABX0GVC1_9ACTN|nr:hypothetical protein [Motilibacter deserti]NHC13580.1 hypothetical protein [Motilibacter deserti]
MAWVWLAFTLLWLVAAVVLVRTLEVAGWIRVAVVASAACGCLGAVLILVDSGS